MQNRQADNPENNNDLITNKTILFSAAAFLAIWYAPLPPPPNTKTVVATALATASAVCAMTLG